MNAVFFYVPLDNERDKTGYFDQLAATLPINRRYFSKIVMHTSQGAVIPDNFDFDAVVRLDSSETQYPHYMRVMSWLDYLESPLFDANTVFLDADVVLNRAVDEVFDQNFCLAFSAMPSQKSYSCINTGVIFASHARKTEAISAMREVFEIATRLKLVPDPRFPMMKTAGRWGLDEMCLNQYLEEKAIRGNASVRATAEDIGFGEIRPFFGTSVALAGAKYNADARSLAENLWHSASALHFPGRPKDKLFEYCAMLSENPRTLGHPGEDTRDGNERIVESSSGSLIAWIWRMLRRRG